MHALAYCTMNWKFSILHSASLRAVLKTKHSQQSLTHKYLAPQGLRYYVVYLVKARGFQSTSLPYSVYMSIYIYMGEVLV